MTPIKIAWLVWCILWMFFWITVGWILVPVNPLMFAVSAWR